MQVGVESNGAEHGDGERNLECTGRQLSRLGLRCRVGESADERDQARVATGVAAGGGVSGCVGGAGTDLDGDGVDALARQLERRVGASVRLGRHADEQLPGLVAGDVCWVEVDGVDGASEDSVDRAVQIGASGDPFVGGDDHRGVGRGEVDVVGHVDDDVERCADGKVECLGDQRELRWFGGSGCARMTGARSGCEHRREGRSQDRRAAENASHTRLRSNTRN